MYNGEQGPAREWAIRLLAKIGDGVEAERMIKIVNAQGGIPTTRGGMRPSLYPQEVVEDVLQKGYAVPCVSGGWMPGKEYKEDRERYLARIKEHRDFPSPIAFVGTPCAPYVAGWEAVKGTHVAYGESAFTIYMNSVVGVKSHGNTSPGLFAQAITGRTPYWGLHTDEGRRGKILVNVETDLLSSADCHALAYYVGWEVAPCGSGSRVPVYEGVLEHLKEDLTIEHLRGLGTALAVAAGGALFHAVGITPEAPTLDVAFGGEKPEETITFGKRELQEAYGELSTHGPEKVDRVVLGCPQYDLMGLLRVYKLLRGRKVHEDVTLSIQVPGPVKMIADRMGITEAIEAAGGQVNYGCWEVSRTEGYMGGPGLHNVPKVVATYSVKCCHYIKSCWGTRPCRPGRGPLDFPRYDVWFGSEEKCIEAAVTGRWRE